MPFLKVSWIADTNTDEPEPEQIAPDAISSSPENPSEQATPEEQKEPADNLVSTSTPLSPSCEGPLLNRESCEKKSGKNV